MPSTLSKGTTPAGMIQGSVSMDCEEEETTKSRGDDKRRRDNKRGRDDKKPPQQPLGTHHHPAHQRTMGASIIRRTPKKAIYHRYMGWFDGNPAHLWEQPPVQAGKSYVEAFGGVELLLKAAKSFAEKKDLRFAATLYSHAVFSQPEDEDMNKQARAGLTGVLTSLGYGAENGPWRNFFLQGARELNSPIEPSPIEFYGLSSMMALNMEQLMDSMAIRLDGPKSFGDTKFTIQWNVPDMPGEIHEQAVLLTFDHASLTNRPGEYREYSQGNADNVNLGFWVDHKTMVQMVIGDNPDPALIKRRGRYSFWVKLQSRLTFPNPGFAIVTPEPLNLEPKNDSSKVVGSAKARTWGGFFWRTMVFLMT